MSATFDEILAGELDVINFRRDAIRDGVVARERAANLPSAGQSARTVPDDRIYLRKPGAAAVSAVDDLDVSRRGTRHLAPGSDLTGLALSGGGIRSASFCLGVLQALDSLSDHNEPHVLDAVDYISVVSGGSYIGTSLVAGMMQPDYTFPFDSRLDGQETPETQHLRNYSNFLVPTGAIDYVTSGILVVRGLLVNAVIVLPALLGLAVLTLVCAPYRSLLKHANLLGWPLDDLPPWLPILRPFGHFVVSVNLAAVLAFVLFVSALIASLTLRKSTLQGRRKTAYGLAGAASLVILVAIFELQPFVLDAMFSQHEAAIVKATAPAAPIPPGGGVSGGQVPAGGVLETFAAIVPTLAAILVPIAAFLIAAAQRLANVAKATLGEATWSGFFKKHASQIAICLVAVIVPFFLWVEYIYLAYWGVRQLGSEPYLHAPKAFAVLAGHLPAVLGSSRLGEIGWIYLVLAIVLAVVCLFIGPNANSLHNLYRDRLSKAFLYERKELTPSFPPHRIKPAELDRWRFSSLKPFKDIVADPEGSGTGTRRVWLPGSAFAPYLLVNTAINLEGSTELNKRGRNADTFVFSPLFIGSRATNYAETKAQEAVEKNLSLATAMAISGAAASANMGANTIKPLTFSLSLLNIRLGYWLANPIRICDFKKWLTWVGANVGTFFFGLETAGLLDETTLNVYLTDGGHIENLGIYELLHRRCRVIVAVDAEADQQLTFGSFVKLQVMARIDLGIRIDLPWQAIRDRKGEGGAPSRGPHAAIGVIQYGEHDRGVLIYLKSSLSGDENDYVEDYKRRNATFPHETTVDQFFSEEQFEVYRALGFHAAQKLFTGADVFGTLPAGAETDWPAEVAAALKLLNLSDDAIGQIVARV